MAEYRSQTSSEPSTRGRVLHLDERLAVHCHTGYYHELEYMDQLHPPDGFVLFNSGVGQAFLWEHWHPTIHQALQTHRPLLFTSYDEDDQRYDMAFLERMHSIYEMDLDWQLEPALNPFECLKYTEHLQDPGRFVKSSARVFSVAQRRRGEARARE